MKAQGEDVLSDIGEDNFDRAFRFLRPGMTFHQYVVLWVLTKSVGTVIQGGSDMGHRLSEDEVQRALDFCGKLFAPTSPDEHRAAERLLTEKLKGQVTESPDPETANLRFLDVHAPIIDPQIIETVVRGRFAPTPRSASDVGDTAPDFQSDAKNPATDSGRGEWDMKTILEKVNARRVIHSEHGNGVHNFEDEPLGQSGTDRGWVARLDRGRLGLVRADTLTR